MKENVESFGPSSIRTRRFAGAAAGLGAIGVVALMLLSPLAAAGVIHPMAFKGSAWTPSSSSSSNGCATSKSSPPRFSKTTGYATWSGLSHSATCKTIVGGVGSSSYSSASGGVEVVAPVKLYASSSGVNVTWGLDVNWSIKATVPVSSTCPSTYSYSYSYCYTYISSWVNTTDYNGYCDASASADLYGSVYLLDTTSGSTFYPTNYWYGAYHQFSRSNSSSSSVTNYSNPSQWSNNYSSSYTSGYQSGAPGSGTITGGMSPTWFINGTFKSTDKYVVVAQISGSVYASIQGLKSASTTASLVMSGTTNHAALQVVVW